MLFVNKLKVLTLMTCLMLVGQAFAANCAADYVPPENPVWDGSAKTEPCTIGGYYIIDNAAKLAWYAAKGSDSKWNWSRGNAKLTADIDLDGKLWTPIAAGKGGATEYTKTFDGNGHVVYNLYIKASELAQINKEYVQNLGFVGVLGGGTIKNLILENVNIQATTNAGSVNGLTTDNQISVGAFVGWMSEKGSSRVDTCMASGTIRTTGNGQGVGGIVGNAKKGTISNCLSLVEIHTSGSDSYVGGIIGITKTDVIVSSCVYAGPGLTNTGAEGLTGGIAGNVFTGKLTTNDNYFEGTGINGVGGTICKSKKGECTKENAESAANSIANADAQNVNETNADDVACALNGTNEDGSCKEEPWSVGQTGLSLNGYGADGYKITFKAKSGSFSDGTVSKNIFLQKGMIISAAEIGVPTHADSAFAGWSLDSNATDPVADLGSVSKATKVYAVWYPIYTVTFSAAPGTFTDDETVKTVKLAKNERITVEDIELPFSYEDNNGVKFYFTGWALTENAPEEDTLSVLPNATDNITLHAVWTQAVTYTVTYNDNGHGKTKVDFVRVEKRQKTSAPDDPESDDGYVFAGWYEEPSCDKLFDFDNTEIVKNWILYAKWEKTPYVISYVMNDVGDKGDNPTSYHIETPTIILTNPNDVEGYVFDGWYNDAGFTYPANKVPQGSTGNKTFYAKWTKKTYRIMYLADNNSQGAVTDQFKEHGLPITLASAGHFNRKGYGAQIGWATVAEGVKVYDFETVYENDAPLTLYPAWGSPIVYTITYVCDVCTGDNPDKPNPHTYTVNDTKGENLPIYNPTYPNNYEFKGWYWDKAYTKRTTNIPMDTVGNLTLYGKTLKYYYLAYELYGSTKANNPEKYTIEQTFTLKDPAPRAGYTFGGWYTEDTFVNQITEIQLGSSEDMTLHAKWIPNTYTVTYDAGTFGEGSIENGTKTHDVDFVLSSETFTRTGYTQEGWENVNGDVVSSPYTENADITLYPHWTLDSYTITYVGAEDLENLNPTSYTVLENDLALLPVAKSGFKFLGWFNASDELVESISAGSTGDITLTAKWAGFPITVATYGGVTILENEDGTRTAAIDASSMETVEIAEDVSVDNVTFDRAFTVGATSTIMLPFSIATSKVSGGKFYEFADMQKNEETGRWAASVKPPEQSELQANKPYLFIPEETSIVFNLGGEPVSLNTSVMNPSTSGNWSFKGVYEKTVFTEEHPELGKAYGFSAEDKNGIKIGQFFKAGVNAWLRPFRAYLAYNESVALAKSTRSVRVSLVNGELPETIDVEIQDGTTRVIGGGTLNTRTGEIKMDRWYDMNGRRLNSKPTTRGTYYYNGKRIVVR